MTELPPAMVSLACFYVFYRGRDWTWFRKFAMAGLICSVAGIAANAVRVSVTRYTQAENFEGNFYDAERLTSISAWHYFEGLMAGPKLEAVLRDMEGMLKTQGYLGNANAKVYIGPRIDFGYAVFGIQPVRGLPLWWESYSNDSLPRTQRMVQRFKDAGFERIILLEDDQTYFPDTLSKYLHTAYQTSTVGRLTVYRKRDSID
jgi:hypothetical protein